MQREEKRKEELFKPFRPQMSEEKQDRDEINKTFRRHRKERQ
jgi:hypothetical protein